MNVGGELLEAEGRGHELRVVADPEPLAPFRDQLVVVSGLSHTQAEALGDGNGDHTRGTATWLNGVHPKWTEGADVRAGTTADQIAAQELGKDTPLPSLELGHRPELRGRQLRERLQLRLHEHAGVADADDAAAAGEQPARGLRTAVRRRRHAAQRLAQMRKTRSILDSVTRRGDRLQQTLGAGDRATVSDYLDARPRSRAADSEGRSERRRVAAAGAGAPGRHPGQVRRTRQADVRSAVAGVPGRHHAGLHVHAGPRSQLADASRRSASPNRTTGCRTTGRSGTARESARRSTPIRRSCSRRSSRSCDRRPTATAPARPLVLLYGAGLSNPQRYIRTSTCRSLVVGGGTGQLKGGRHLQYPLDTPMTNLLLTCWTRSGSRSRAVRRQHGTARARSADV